MRYVKQSGPKVFTMRDEEYYKKLSKGRARYIPNVVKGLWWMSSEDNRDLLSEVIAASRRALRMMPVNSNAELIDRIDEYFSIVQGRRVPPTIEEFSLYMGYSTQVIRAMAEGTNLGFPDIPYPGCTTKKLLERCIEALHAADAVQAMKRMSDSTTYIFRSKNYYGMRDNRETPIQINLKTPDALPPDQIAKLLPELVPDRSMDDVDIV